MKINNLKTPTFGILRKHVVKSYPIGYLDIVEGNFKNYDITIYKEFLMGKLDLKFYLVKDKIHNIIRSRLQHIDKGKVIKQIDRII